MKYILFIFIIYSVLALLSDRLEGRARLKDFFKFILFFNGGLRILGLRDSACLFRCTVEIALGGLYTLRSLHLWRFVSRPGR